MGRWAPPPNLTPMYGCAPFTPASPCPHRGPIPRESRLYCERCGQSGWDWHPYFRPSADDPRPDPKPAPQASPPTPVLAAEVKLTRRVLRALRFGPPRSTSDSRTTPGARPRTADHAAPGSSPL